MTRKRCLFSGWEAGGKRGEMNEKKKNKPAASVLRIQQVKNNSTVQHVRSPVHKPLGLITSTYEERKGAFPYSGNCHCIIDHDHNG